MFYQVEIWAEHLENLKYKSSLLTIKVTLDSATNKIKLGLSICNIWKGEKKN